MENEQLLKKIKRRAFKEWFFIRWVPIFAFTTLVVVVGIFITGKGRELIFYIFPLLILVLPIVLFLYGYNNRKIITAYMKEQILCHKIIINYYFRPLREVQEKYQQELEELKEIKKDSLENWSNLKNEIIQENEIHIYFITKFFEGLEETISEMDILDKIEVEKRKEEEIESAHTEILDIIAMAKKDIQNIDNMYDNIETERNTIIARYKKQIAEKIQKEQDEMNKVIQILKIYTSKN